MSASPWLAPDACNPILARLQQRLPVLALGVRHARTADIARYAKATGHHAIWVDLEHSTMGVDCAAQICAAAADLGLAPLVRVPERDYGVIGRLLDGGAMGIIAPRIETAQQAAEIAAACQFPPQGHRSAIASLPQLGFQKVTLAELQQAMNRTTLLQILIESPEGIANAEAIARVPGVGMLAVGTNDLCAEMGVPGEFRHPGVRAAHFQALEACRRAGKPLAIGGIGDAAYSAELVAAGAAPFVMTGIDSDILLAALHERVRQSLTPYQT
jgi:2-keto-3-deoxy-L-rhamnonate aldolase RhmA